MKLSQSLGVIFDHAVFSMKRLQAQFSCISALTWLLAILVAYKRKTLDRNVESFGSLNGNFVSNIQVPFVMADMDHCKSGSQITK